MVDLAFQSTIRSLRRCVSLLATDPDVNKRKRTEQRKSVQRKKQKKKKKKKNTEEGRTKAGEKSIMCQIEITGHEQRPILFAFFSSGGDSYGKGWGGGGGVDRKRRAREREGKRQKMYKSKTNKQKKEKPRTLFYALLFYQTRSGCGTWGPLTLFAVRRQSTEELRNGAWCITNGAGWGDGA